MKNVVILVNGTWNDDDNQERSLLTNVVWLRELCECAAISRDDQVVRYMDGVGSGGFVDKALGGVFGRGLKDGICAAYQSASEEYAVGDKIYFFGFSRGAYTVRTAADMIASVGLVDLSGVADPEKRKEICQTLYKVYKKEANVSEIGAIPFFNADTPQDAVGRTEIHLVGVWDTVGTAGIPDHYRILNAFDGVSKGHNWANMLLSDVVQNGRHAIGMDEYRESFVPAFWTDENGDMINDARVKQLWFSGVHTDIGGGYEHRDLGNIAMGWMTKEATGLGFLVDPDPARPIPKDRALGVVNDSMTSVFKKMWSRPRGVPNLSDKANKALFHPSVLARYSNDERASIPDWAANEMTEGQEVKRVAKAAKRWSPMGVFLEPDKTYEIAAQGVWHDLKRDYGPDGEWINQPSGFMGKLLDAHVFPKAIATVARQLRRNAPYRRVPGAWRIPESKAFVLMGVVAGGRGVQSIEGVTLAKPHTTFEIGKGVRVGAGTAHPIEKGGYLYCFPNDVWQMYHNNNGELDVTITMVP